MGFCPYYDSGCPGDSSCAAYKSFGCSACYLPGIPAVFTDPPADPVDVFILQMFSEKAAVNDGVMIAYTLVSDGTIHFDDDISKFVITLA